MFVALAETDFVLFAIVAPLYERCFASLVVFLMWIRRLIYAYDTTLLR
jgi:hypothetical protein